MDVGSTIMSLSGLFTQTTPQQLQILKPYTDKKHSRLFGFRFRTTRTFPVSVQEPHEQQNQDMVSCALLVPLKHITEDAVIKKEQLKEKVF
ncbi:hypothetical protein EOD39_3619 [Acipenser ruthenus]|uniref:Uncharacterized protein n=1 Tax=Acipenser ruthenus TaxID=7906 RepID=A0A444UM65_ACIRT|nr:hypothetical protein EOD39_3619 [Acipenser ruthenus]